MARRTEKEPLFPTRGPKTIQRNINKMLTGDGRKKAENMLKNDFFNHTFGCEPSAKK